jgi:putative oxidoreductase
MAGLCYAFGRVLVSSLFIVSGYLKFMSIGAVATAFAARSLPVPVALETWTGLPRYEAAGYALALIEVLCGVMVLIGFKARFAAVLLTFTGFAMILINHDSSAWQASLQDGGQMPVLCSLSILGALLLIAAAGAGPWSFDRRANA